MGGQRIYCKVCGRTMDEINFYTSYNIEKYPLNGRIDTCKKCLTMMVDCWNPKTYLPILEELDVPYIPEEWNKVLAKYASDPSKITAKGVMGKYLAKMRMVQYKDYRWKDNEYIQQLADERTRSAMQVQGYDEPEIQKVLDQAHFSNFDTSQFVWPEYVDPRLSIPPNFGKEEPQEKKKEKEGEEEVVTAEGPILLSNPYFEDTLTDEDKSYLCLKWGYNYRPEELVQLEQLFEEMNHSYEITTAGDVNTLKLACKASLKANQLLDIGD